MKWVKKTKNTHTTIEKKTEQNKYNENETNHYSYLGVLRKHPTEMPKRLKKKWNEEKK